MTLKCLWFLVMRRDRQITEISDTEVQIAIFLFLGLARDRNYGQGDLQLIPLQRVVFHLLHSSLPRPSSPDISLAIASLFISFSVSLCSLTFLFLWLLVSLFLMSLVITIRMLGFRKSDRKVKLQLVVFNSFFSFNKQDIISQHFSYRGAGRQILLFLDSFQFVC